jgi:hypothetical protein
MSADNRTTHTDAVATLGTILDNTQKRDAIHLATEPLIANHKLYPGQDVGIDTQGFANASNVKLLGIVDPFLKAPVMPGERFWLIVYPRQISTLRHIWSHPDFPETISSVQVTNVMAPDTKTDKQFAMEYFLELATEKGISVADILAAAAGDEGTEYLYVYGSSGSADIYTDQDFWDKYNDLTGRDVVATDDSYDDGCRGC